ncbi:unnamed protein product [Pylaiella littoralis]
MDEDMVLAALLTALEDLHNIRNEMHTCIKQARQTFCGFLNMAKARRSIGRNSVSVLDTREEYSAEVTISIKAEGCLGERFEESKSTFSRNRSERVPYPVVVRDGSLRQRGGVAAPVEIEESLLQPDQDAPVRGDSMSLFATLVPPPLRKSKKNFSSVVDYAVEASNLAHRILCLQKVLREANGLLSEESS